MTAPVASRATSLPQNADRVAAVMYEDYIGVLEDGSDDAMELTKFLRALL